MICWKNGRALGPLVLGTALVSGCGHPAARALEGRWFGDSVENFDPTDVAPATGWARGTSLEFSGGHVTVAIPAEDPRKGRFEVESAHEGDLVVAISDEKGGAPTRARFTLDGDRYLRWKIDERRSVVLRREQ
ncbi:MAG TPA: hypothetical protein VHE30_00885 [Polyangiaceae bacterium]|nr:hypothetical protein [Polyangiaceae bacterium]